MPTSSDPSDYRDEDLNDGYPSVEDLPGPDDMFPEIQTRSDGFYCRLSAQGFDVHTDWTGPYFTRHDALYALGED